jgi:tetratricopeptide (TPR) repeat protein
MPTIKKKGHVVQTHTEQGIMTIAHHIGAFVETYKKNLVLFAFLCMAVLALAAGYLVTRYLQEQKAAPLLAAAYDAYRPFGGTTADFDKALALFRGVQSAYPGTVSGAVAQYSAGNCLMGLGRTEEAIKEYQKYIQTYSGEKVLLGLAYQRLGYAYLVLGKQPEAVKAFEQAETTAGPGIATFELARLYEAAGDAANAQNKYKLILDKLNETSWGREAMGKVQKIAAPAPGASKEAK